jgi:very-short-patch-repair endonuclease
MCTTSDAVLAHARLLEIGLPRRRIAAGVADGSLVRLRRGVYARDGACTPVRTAARHGGALACVSAAQHLNLWTLSAESAVHVWLGGHGHGRAHGSCACVEHWDAVAGADAFGIPSVPRVLRQLLACRGVEEFFVALESALRQGLIAEAGLAWLRATTNDAARGAIGFARRDADSGLESLLRWRLRRHHLRIRSQVTIFSVGRVDFLIGDRLILEADGRGNHDGATARHKDLVRDANAAAWGYVTLRFDYALIIHDWDAVERAILAQVERGHHLYAQ